MMPTEAMRLDAEEEAARGAVEHLLKTLERDAAAPGKLPAQEAPPVESKGVENGKTENESRPLKKLNNVISEGVSENGVSRSPAPLRNGSSEVLETPVAAQMEQEEKFAPDVGQQEDVSRVLSNVLDEVENNVDTSRAPQSEEAAVEQREEASDSLENSVPADSKPEGALFCKIEVEQEAPLLKIKEEIPEYVDNVVLTVEDIINDETTSNDDGGKEIEDRINVEKSPNASVELAENASTHVAKKTVDTNSEDKITNSHLDKVDEAAQTCNAPTEPKAIEAGSPKSKKSKAKKAPLLPAADQQQPPLPSPLEELDHVVSKCVSNMCDVLESVDQVVTTVDDKEKKTASPKSKSKRDSPKVAKSTREAAPKPAEKVTANDETVLVTKSSTKESKKEKEVHPAVDKKDAPKKNEKPAKSPPKVPSQPEKAKRKPRKKKQQPPLVAPVLPFSPYFPPPMMAPQPQMPINYNFPPPIPVDLSVGKKKVQKVAPIPSMMHMMPPMTSSSLGDQVLDLSVKKHSKPPSEKKVKPIKRLSKKALQSVFHPTEMMRMAASHMIPPPVPMVIPQESRKSKKTVHNSMPPPPPPPSVAPFIFQIEEHHHGLAPNGTKVYNCDVCNSSYQRQFSLKRHYLRTHINARLVSERDISNCGIAVGPDTPPNLTDLYRCHLCPALFFTRREKLVGHLALHPEDSHGEIAPLTTPSSQVFSCDFCSTTFASKLNMLKHEALHQTQDYPCFYCYKVFSSPTAREKHHKQHTNNDNQHPCMFLCGKTLRTLPELRAHLQNLHNKEYFGCSKCNERFLDNNQLELHGRLAHSGPVHEPPIISITPIIEDPPVMLPPPPQTPAAPTEDSTIKYSCSMCSETFPSYVSLCKHRKSHGTIGKHTKAPASPQKTNKECPPVAPVKSSSTMVVYLESKEEHEAGVKSESEKFSLPNLSSGKQTVALTSEVTISALPLDEEEEEERIEPVPIVEEPPEDEPPPPSPVDAVEKEREPSPISIEEEEEEEDVPKVSEKKKPQLKLKVKLNFGKKTAKRKKKKETKKKELPKRAVAAKPTKAVHKESPKEKSKPQEALAEPEVQPAEEEKTLPVDPPKVEEKAESRVIPDKKIEPAPEPFEEVAAPAYRPHSKKFLSRNWEKSPQKPEDLSHLSLSTQDTVKRRSNASKRKQSANGKKNSRKSSSRPTRNNPHTSEDLASFLQGLELGQTKFQVPVEKRRSRKLIQGEQLVEELVEEGFTGDWIRPKRYICHICRGRFTELWDLDDHVNEVHTNIWCTYMDVEATTSLPEDLFIRFIQPNGAINEAPVHPLTDPTKSDCTKCGKTNTTLSDLHTHMLECGGDTTWMLNSPRKKKQWRPFGTRRRARRGMKRIPSSPVKLNRPKRPDADSIQRMIANLPSKRGSRRVINFNDDDIKTRSQATIHSLRPGGSNQSPSKTRLAKQQLPKVRSTTMAISERRSSFEASKTAEKAHKQTAKPLPEEITNSAPTNSQEPPVVKLKKKKMTKKAEVVAPLAKTAEVAADPAPVAAPVEPVQAPPTEPAPKFNKYARCNCQFCDKGLINYFSLVRHLKCCPKNPDRETAKKPEPSKEVLEAVNACPLCNEVFTSNKLLERHASNCCESPTEIGNRKKLFRRRPSEVSVSSKKSEAESVLSSASDMADPNKLRRRKRGKGKPFFIRKNATKKLILRAKMPMGFQRLSRSLEVSSAEESVQTEKRVGSHKRPKAKRKSELENLILTNVPAKTETVNIEVEEKVKKLPNKKTNNKKAPRSIPEAPLPIIEPEPPREDESIEAQLGHLDPVVPKTLEEKSELPISNNDEQGDSFFKRETTSEDSKKKKKKHSTKISKKDVNSVSLADIGLETTAVMKEPESQFDTQLEGAKDKKKKKKAAKKLESLPDISATVDKIVEDLAEPEEEIKKKHKSGPKKKQSDSSKSKDSKRKSKKADNALLNDLVGSPEKETVTERNVSETVDNDVKKSKSKKKKKLNLEQPEEEAKERKGLKAKNVDDEELPLSQIIKNKKSSMEPEEGHQQQEEISTAEPSIPEPSPEKKPKKDKKKAARNNGEGHDEEPPKKKHKVESELAGKPEKRPMEEHSSSEDSPKKKRGRRSDEKSESSSTYCKICGTGYSTAFNYHKHLKSMKHLNNVLTLESGGAVSSTREPSPEPESHQDSTFEAPQQEEEVEDPDEIVFPFIKEGTPPVCPPPPPPSPCSPRREEEKPVAETEAAVEEPKAVEPEKKAEVKAKSSKDDEEDDDWLSMSQPPPPPPKWDFDAVRDSVPDWTSKPTTFQASPTARPADPIFGDHVLGGMVNQMISHDEYPPAVAANQGVPVSEEMLMPPNNPYLMGNYEGQQSLDQIQQAMGATDEEMAMLENLGGDSSLAFQAFVYDNSGPVEYEEAQQHPSCSATLVNLANATGPIEPLENADIMDLDNQNAGQPAAAPQDAPRMDEEMQPMAAKYAAKPGLLLESDTSAANSDDELPSNSTKLLSMYEQKEMVCPMCSKHFLGLQALETHISWAHKVKDTKSKVVTDAKGVAKSTDQVARDRDCLLVGLAAANMLHHAGGIRGGVLRAAAGAVADECVQQKRKIACFVCKELYTDMVALNAHIRKQHVKSKSEQAATKENGLKQQMTTALGGLLDRALTSMLGKVPLSNAEKSSGDAVNQDEPNRNWEEPKPVPMHINMDPPLTLTAIAKKAIKPVSISENPSLYESTDVELSKSTLLAAESVIAKRKKSAASKEPQKPEDGDKPPLFPENFVTPSSFDPILPEPQGADMQCPICLGAVKHFHSLCRHLKTQHMEWSMNTFNTDLFHYLILKRDNPPITINKKYSIYIPLSNRISHPELGASGSSSQPTEEGAEEMTSPSSSASFTPTSVDVEAREGEDIRMKAYAALQQLSTKKSVRGSKRRPLDINDLQQADKDSSTTS